MKIRTAEEIAVGYKFYRIAQRGVKASGLPLLLIWFSIIGYIACFPNSTNGPLWAIPLCAPFFAWAGTLVLAGYLCDRYCYVDTKLMLYIGEKVSEYPDFRDDLCRILTVRPKLTFGEYQRLNRSVEAKIQEDQQAAMSAECAAQKAADVAEKLADEEAWSSMLKQLRCNSNTGEL